ncbi:MAG: hypothetical protein Q8P95_01405 [bacterium]|nr:hypothetical protein [bacterium]
MPKKDLLFLSLIIIIGLLVSSFFIADVLMTQITPFSTLEIPKPDANGITRITAGGDSGIQFVDNDLLTGWLPWVIKQISILIGALSLAVFFYAGIKLIIKADNEEELKNSTKMIIFGVVGITISALSYSLVANILALTF